MTHEEPIPAEEIQEEQIDDFIPQPKGQSKVEDFDLLAHLQLEEEKEEGDDDEDEADPGEEPEQEVAVPIYKKVVPNIQHFWIKQTPDHEDYIGVILSTFTKGLE